MLRIMTLLAAAMAMAACAGDEKKPTDPLADVTDASVKEGSEQGEPVVVEESATGDSEVAADEAPADQEIGAGLKNLKIQEPVETIAMPSAPAAVPVKPIAKVAPKKAPAAVKKTVVAKVVKPKAGKADGKHLWVFVDTLVVRGKPSKAASQVGTVAYGAMVPVLEAKDGFVKIGENQWVSRRFLTDRQAKFIPAH